MSELAIVIPAYKDMFFDKTLLSIANQTCKEFTLYIGNDSSLYDLKSLVNLYQDRIDIVYKYFDENLGGKDLVAQWERCIDLVGDENWIWLFSDDDMMDPNCVESFYNTLHLNPQYDLFHFNVTHVDEDRNIVAKITDYPEVLTIEEFLELSLNGNYSFVVEYIFRKSHFYKLGRFQHFDLAWYSDNATWIKLGKKMGIRNIGNANVYFRTSPFNLTPNYSDKDILKRKFYSQIEYAGWIYEQVKKNEIHLEIVRMKDQLETWFFRTIKGKIEYISFGLLGNLICQFYIKFNHESCLKRKIAFLYIYKVYRFIRGILKKYFLNYFKLLRSKFTSVLLTGMLSSMF